MKSLLHQELRELARKILQASDTAELLSLQNDVRVLYEKLIVLRYTDGLVEELRHTLGDTPTEQDEPAEVPVPAEETASADKSQEPPVTASQPQENVSSQKLPAEGSPEEKQLSTAAPIPRPTERPSSSRSRERTSSYDDLQQSLFADDLFTQELNFDPDEDLFEVLQSSSPSSSAYATLDPEGPLPQPQEEEVETSSSAAEREPKESSPSSSAYAALDPEGPLPQPQEEEEGETSSPAAEQDGVVLSREEEAPLHEVVEMETSFFSFQVIRDQEQDTPPQDRETDAAVTQDRAVLEQEECEKQAESPEVPDDEPMTAQPATEELSLENGLESQAEAGKQEQALASVSDYADFAAENAGAEQFVQEESVEAVLSSAASRQQDEIGQDSASVAGPGEEISHPRTLNEVAASQQQESRPSLNQILSAGNARMEMNDRIAFINNLFDGDAEAFEAAVRYIFSLTDIAVANEYIIEILKPSYNNWFEKEEYERRFVEIVLRHLMPKGYRG